MKLRQLFEAPRKVAVAAFGRMNPPTIGHEKLVDAVKSQEGDHYIFLSQTQKPKTDPLPFDVKLEFAKKFFPDVNVGHPSVRTPIQMLQMLEQLGYTDIIYVAGSDRVDSFTKLFNDYNGKEYNFKSIKVVSAGERDPDADGAEGMSASKMRAAAASGDYESFAMGTPNPQLAKKMYDAVRTGMGVKDAVPAEDVEEGWKSKMAGAALVAANLLGTPAQASEEPVKPITIATVMIDGEVRKYNLGDRFENAKEAEKFITNVLNKQGLSGYTLDIRHGYPKKKDVKESNYGKYWCSTDKKWKYRKGPKQSRSS